MLMCGIFWAYIIGKLVEAVSAMGSVAQEYIERMNQANQMVSDFTTKCLPNTVVGTTISTKASKRVRRFITCQRDMATNKWLESHSSPTLTETYPTLSILSPELQKVCSLHLVHTLLETIPYLSSTYLSPEEQAYVALKCVTLEFSTGEQFSEHPDLGRGILICRNGFGFASRYGGSRNLCWFKGKKNYPIDVNEVLVEDDYNKERHIVFHFVGFTKVLFIPRSVIMDVLEKNQRAWKMSARWRYFQAALILCSLKDPEIPWNDIWKKILDMCVIRCSGCVLFWMGMAHNFGFNMNYYHWATFLVKSIGWLRLLCQTKMFHILCCNY